MCPVCVCWQAHTNKLFQSSNATARLYSSVCAAAGQGVCCRVSPVLMNDENMEVLLLVRGRFEFNLVLFEGLQVAVIREALTMSASSELTHYTRWSSYAVRSTCMQQHNVNKGTSCRRSSFILPMPYIATLHVPFVRMTGFMTMFSVLVCYNTWGIREVATAHNVSARSQNTSFCALEKKSCPKN
jgi:hypothetical protein